MSWSRALRTWSGSEDPLDAEVVGAAFVSIGALAGEEFEEALIGGLIPQFEARATTKALAVLLAIGSVAQGRAGKAASVAADRLVQAGVARPEWAADLGERVRVGDCQRLDDSQGTAQLKRCHRDSLGACRRLSTATSTGCRRRAPHRILDPTRFRSPNCGEVRVSPDDASYFAPWCTNWGAPEFDVPKLWSFVRYEGSDANWSQASAWQKTSELIDYYRSELQQKRDDLVTKWPTDRSPAAQVFVEYVDDLLKSMDETASKAYANSQAISGITSALTDAKNKLGGLKDKWQSYQEKEAAFLAGVAQGPAAAVSWLPSGWQQGIADTVTGVPTNWRQDLKDQAIKVMVQTDQTVAEHKGQMKVPVEYQPLTPQRDDTGGVWPTGGGSGGRSSGGSVGGGRAPVIPPPPPTPPGPVLTGGAATGTLPSSGGSSFVDTPAGRALAPLGMLGPVALMPPVGFGAGPKPSGTGPGGPPSERLPGRTGVPAERLLGRSGLPAGVPAEEVPGRTGMPRENLLGRSAFPLEEMPGRGRVAGFGEPLPYGEAGMRSGMPMGGIVGQPAARSGVAAGRRVRPPGGVIGGRGGTSYTTESGHMVTVGQRRSDTDRRDRQNAQVFDPDDPWAVAEGVPPVIEPAAEPQFYDPGPGVIGIDR